VERIMKAIFFKKTVQNGSKHENEHTYNAISVT